MPSASRHRRTGGLLLAALLALGGVVPVGAAAHAAESATVPEGAELTVAPQNPVFETGADEYSFEVLLRNGGDDTIPEGRVVLDLQRTRVETREGLSEEETDREAEDGVRIAAVASGQVAADKEQSLTVTVPRDEFPLGEGDGEGVYLIAATLDLGDGTDKDSTNKESTDKDGTDKTDDESAKASDGEDDGSLSTTVPIVWRGAASDRVPLSSIVPIVLPDEVQSMPSRDRLADAVPGWERLLEQATRHRSTLAIDPRVIAGIRALGDAAPERARTFLAALEESTLPSFLLQFADADPAAQSAIGRDDLLQPTTLDFATRNGDFSSEAADDTEGTKGNDDSEEGDDAKTDDASDGTPGLEDLLTWTGSTAVAWPAEGTVDDDALGLLGDAGFTTAVLDSENVSVTGGTRAKVGGITALVTDHDLEADAREALAGESETEQNAAFSRLAAQLALAAGEHSTGLVLALDRGAVADDDDPARLLERLSELDWVTSTPTDQQADGTAELVEPEPTKAQSERIEQLRTAAEREPSVVAAGAVLQHPEYLEGYQRARLLSLFATRYAEPEQGFDDAAPSFSERDDELLEGVRAITTEHTQLVGTSTRVPLQLRNSLPFDAVVSVSVHPSSAALTVTERRFTDVVVPAETNEQVLIPVRSRVSSGESGLVVSIAANSGEPTVYSGTLAITIQSGVEKIALWSLGILAALLLGFGIWRSVRRRLQPEEEAAGTEAEAGTEEAGTEEADGTEETGAEETGTGKTSTGEADTQE